MDCGKLLELLNEHAHTYADHYDDTGEEIVIDFYKHTDQCFLYTEDGQFESLVDDVVISKRFGFISWLVENDKIDTDAYKTVYSGDLDKRKTLTMSSGGDEFYQVTEHGAYESLLMLLAIQDEPIDFLISILK